MGIFKKVPAVNRGLRYKLLLVFSLMSIIPLLACIYVISIYVVPQVSAGMSVILIVLTSIIIALLGFFMAKSLLVDPIINMAIEAKMIAGGHYGRNLSVSTADEAENLAVSINAMTQKLKTNLDELKSYGQKMKEINVDIHKKALALSSLLQIGDIISSGSIQLDSLLEMAIEKVSMLFESGFGILYLAKDDESDFLPKVECGQEDGHLRECVIKRKGYGILERTLDSRAILVIDSSTKLSKEMEEFLTTYDIKNILSIPIYSGRKKFGMLIISSKTDNFKYRNEDLELAKVFAKQITIAIENDIRNKNMEELVIKDDLTDLYNKNFMLHKLSEEIKRAIFYQRPCSLLILGIDDFSSFKVAHGELASEEALRKIAKVIKDNMIPVGKAARIKEDQFAVLLPEKNRGESFAIAEGIRKKIEVGNFLRLGSTSLTINMGVSESPLDGVTSEELFKKALEPLQEVRIFGKNKVAM